MTDRPPVPGRFRDAWRPAPYFLSSCSPASVHDLAEHNPRQCTDRRRKERRPHDGRRVHAAVLAAVGDHVDGNELKGRDVDNQERTHLVACRAGRLACQLPGFLCGTQKILAGRESGAIPNIFIILENVLEICHH